MESIQKPIQNLHPDEKIIVFARKHWVVFLGSIVIVMIMLLIPVVGLVWFWFTSPDQFLLYQLFIIVGSTIYLFFIMAFFLVSWIDWYFDILIVTDRRVVDIHQKGLFSRTTDELELLHIEDVSSHLKGILGTFFNFGDVFIQTAGSSRNFIFEKIPRPREVARTIMDLYHQRLHTEEDAQRKIDQYEGLGPRLGKKKETQNGSFEDLKKEIERTSRSDMEVLDEKIKKETQERIDQSRKKIEEEINQLKEGKVIKLPQQKQKVLIKFNVHRQRLNDCLEVLPSLKSPTINQLANKDYFAIESVVEEEVVKRLISDLKQRGAENIIESKVDVL